jgi:hypothetical protein
MTTPPAALVDAHAFKHFALVAAGFNARSTGMLPNESVPAEAQDFRQAADIISCLLTALAAAERDRERLDWLERAEAEVSFTGEDAPGGWLVRYGPFSLHGFTKQHRADAPTLRAALDAAAHPSDAKEPSREPLG